MGIINYCNSVTNMKPKDKEFNSDFNLVQKNFLKKKKHSEKKKIIIYYAYMYNTYVYVRVKKTFLEHMVD